MTTVLELPGELLARAEQVAALTGESVEQVFVRSVRNRRAEPARSLQASEPLREWQDWTGLLALLSEYVPAEELSAWLDTPNAALRGERPTKLLAQGRADEIAAELHRLRDGQPL